MKKIFITAVLPLAFACIGNRVYARSFTIKQTIIMTDTTSDKKAIEKVLIGYQDAISSSDVSKVLPLYADNAQLLGAKMPSVIGISNIKEAYTGGFKIFHLDVKFKIEEVNVSGDLAYARTSSRGTMLIVATGVKTPEENRELFVLKKINGEWKIAVYMFNQDK